MNQLHLPGLVAGAQYEGRPEIIQRFVKEDEKVFLNAYSENAIKIYLKNGLEIGFVPEEYAPGIADYLNNDFPHKAYVLRIYIGRETNLPLIQVFILRKESDIPGLVYTKDLPQIYSDYNNLPKEDILTDKKTGIIGNFINRFFK